MSYEEAREVILAGRGRHFDPDVVDAFLTNYAEFVRIAERHSDTAA
jgi:putative two-component system response regulator